ncbi:uncharacterized protein LOC131066249 [Cryptomeria japonica]|uniref:uncharacterized protein LOC131066249 n=1 Tax=Cryptomeria japonica TaxID=3369 RepID=UPI0025AD33B4|nr:uncharacterized protein LOC131066249 [Cryptomeria japonica]XP_057856951.1 uncharacterized protein LOC131066249 [Cryptomeria japonica]XP_057856952.1 uncharacterized protein LOC131066249 [Cryptomeria japonica]
MGNCQASDAATVIVEHPGGKTEKIYWSVSANEVMGSNPGHYVALVTTVSTKNNSDSMPQKQLKLLRPEDTLHIGHNYRLVSFEEVLMEFSGKSYVKLNKLLSLQKVKDSNREQSHSVSLQGDMLQDQELNIRRGIGGTRFIGRQGQWKPALQSISEVGR